MHLQYQFQVLDWCTGEFQQTVKEERMSILYSLFQRLEVVRILPNLL